MAYRTHGTRLLAAAGLAALAALAGQGCTSQASPGTANASPPGSRTARPVTEAEAGEAFAVYRNAISTGAYYTDAKSLASATGVARVTYGAAQRAFPRRHRQAAGGIRLGQPVFYLPEPAGYPQWFVAEVTAANPGRSPGPATQPGAAPEPSSNSRRLVVFEKASATAAWQLASESTLSPGESTPALAKDGSGHVPVVPLSDAALVSRPDVAGPLQAAVVDDGPASPAARVVASGPLTTGIYQAARASGFGLKAPHGDVYRWDLEGSRYPELALRTADGGALVFYAMYLIGTVAVPTVVGESAPVSPGPPITVPAYLAPLLPPGAPAPRVSLEAQQLLSFAAVDPPAAAGRLRVIAIGGGVSYASAS